MRLEQVIFKKTKKNQYYLNGPYSHAQFLRVDKNY